MSKRGIIFSLLAIGLSGLFIILFSSSYEQPVDEREDTARARVERLDASIDDFYRYAQKAQQTAGRGALEAMYGNSYRTRAFLGDGNFNATFAECLNDSSSCPDPMNEDNLTALLSGYRDLLEESGGFDMDFSVVEVEMVDERAWTITMRSNISISLTDDYATWGLHKAVITDISTVGAKDPAYIAISDLYGGDENRTIKQNDIQDGTSWNLSMFMDFYANKEYHRSLEGSCLSDRFEGSFSGPLTRCSIESVVNPDEHPLLKNPENRSIAHLDWQAATQRRYLCDDGVTNDPFFRVSIEAVDEDLVLTEWDATRYNLNTSAIWNETGGVLGAPGCP
ncbi:hypothetical protein JXA12_00135 [Candidatus Woesearchaeota archaeon]|nr:hypothetical protein [Candidatus Woesearchaeota archaeon]